MFCLPKTAWPPTSRKIIVRREEGRGSSRDNPRKLGKGCIRLVGATPLKLGPKGSKGGGNIHQLLW